MCSTLYSHLCCVRTFLLKLEFILFFLVGSVKIGHSVLGLVLGLCVEFRPRLQTQLILLSTIPKIALR